MEILIIGLFKFTILLLWTLSPAILIEVVSKIKE
jgi:hypothetical protein